MGWDSKVCLAGTLYLIVKMVKKRTPRIRTNLLPIILWLRAIGRRGLLASTAGVTVAKLAFSDVKKLTEVAEALPTLTWGSLDD